MTREASNCTTATNYALEGEIRDRPSIPAIPGEMQGPWLEVTPNRQTNVPTNLILTKTHCRGFCNGDWCGEEESIHSVRSFLTGCLMGTRAVKTDQGLVKMNTEYHRSLVQKAVHIFRSPLDNIVARFHLTYNVRSAAGDRTFVAAYPRNQIGFHRWCALEDQNRAILDSRFLDRPLRQAMRKIPCFNEFFRYVQWHNLAFSVSSDLNLPTLLLHYDEYSTDFVGTRDRLLDFLELPRVGVGIEFHSGKTYESYYSTMQKQNIRAFLREFASAQTWEQVDKYDFGSP